MKKKTVFYGMLLALALIFSYVEALVPIPIPIPGIKLGLANLLIVLLLYLTNWKACLAINVLRVILSGFLFGNLFAILYGLSGAIVSFCLMLLLQRSNCFHVITVSMAGGIFHNFAQILVASILLENGNVWFYFPILIVAGLITGILNGILAKEIYIRLPIKKLMEAL